MSDPNDDAAIAGDGFSEKPTSTRAEIMAWGRGALKRLDKREKLWWPDWQHGIRLLGLGSREVMAKLGTTSPQGRAYSRTFNRWLYDNGCPPVDPTTRAAAIQCAPILEQINEWRENIKRTNPRRLRRLLGPQANLRGYLKSLEQPVDEPPEEPPERLFADYLDTAEIAALIIADFKDNDRAYEVAESLAAQTGGWNHMVSLVVGSPIGVIRDNLIHDMGLSHADLRQLADPDEPAEPEPTDWPSPLFSSNSTEWSTPQGLFDELNQIFDFTIDLAASEKNTKVDRYYTIADDALKQDWSREIGFLDPPFGRDLARFVQKSYESSVQGATILCVLPGNTDASWFHDWCMKADTIVFLRGRLKFGNAANTAPKGTMLVLFTPNGQRDGKPEILWDVRDLAKARKAQPAT